MTGPGKAAFDAMVEEATIDCHNEEEQLTGLATMIEENLEVPFATRVLGLAVAVTGITHTSHGLVADCVHGQHKQAIHVLDLPMPQPPPKGAEWIAAYRHWKFGDWVQVATNNPEANVAATMPARAPMGRPAHPAGCRNSLHRARLRVTVQEENRRSVQADEGNPVVAVRLNTSGGRPIPGSRTCRQ